MREETWLGRERKGNSSRPLFSRIRKEKRKNDQVLKDIEKSGATISLPEMETKKNVQAGK